MFRYNLLIAFRNILRHKGSFFINLAGLSTGLACTFLIYLWVNDELNFDRFHQNDPQLFQVMETSTENGQLIVREGTQGPLAEAMKADLPEVIEAVPLISMEKNGMEMSIRADGKTIKSHGIFTRNAFFNMFSFPLTIGNNSNLLPAKESMVVSEKLASSLFGSPENAVGKDLAWEIFGRKSTSRITGVLAPLPPNNSMNFDFVANWDLLYYDLFPGFQQWSNTGGDTYLLLKKDINIARFNAKIERFLSKYQGAADFTLSVRPYSSAYLHGKYENGRQAGGRIEYVQLFSLVAIFILVIACINFMNLSTAKASHRLKEVGIKKVIGSSRKSLVIQFLSEAILMVFLSTMLAAALVILLMPAFNQLTGKALNISIDLRLIGLVLLITLITGLFAGSYPAFYMSALQINSLFKGRLKKSVPELIARKGLVVFQFVLSLILIVGVLVIVKQVNYVQTKNIGYDRSNIVQFEKEGNLNEKEEAFLTELKKLPGVQNASSLQQNLMQKGNGSSTYGIDWPGKPADALIDIAVRAVSHELIETLGIQVTEGRSFSKAFMDGDKGLIFNETAIRLMGLKDPVGTKLKMWGEERTIIGVVKDFHISSLHEAIAPVALYYDPQKTSTMMVKIETGKERETIAQIEELYKSFNPGFLFSYSFFDELYQAQYIAEQRVSALSKYFAALAILISCLGLFGLAAYNAAVRNKEIAIRKVLGASVAGILSKDFLLLIILAMVIGFPLSWIAMNAWLNGFAYRVNIGMDLFLIASGAMILLVLITIGYQSVKLAISNPIGGIRAEH